MQEFSWNQWNAEALSVRRNNKGQCNNFVWNLIEVIFGSAGGFEPTERLSVIWTSVILLPIRLKIKYFNHFSWYNSSRVYLWKLISNVIKMLATVWQPPWASDQIRKMRGCACSGNAGIVYQPPTSKKLLINDPDMHHGTCVTHVSWCMSGSLTRGSGENDPGTLGAYATGNFTYLVTGQCVDWTQPGNN